MALLFAAAALVHVLPSALVPPALHAAGDELFFALVVEGGFLLAQATLVDIATRLKKRPPLWAAVLIVAAVILFSQYSLEVVRLAWERGTLVFVPLLFSLAERGAVLWRMPGRPRIEKIAARALIANRIATGLALLALTVATMIAGMAFGFHDVAESPLVPLLAGALYFAVAAFDDFRVRGRQFAERPRVLFGYDAIGITYLEPV